MVDVSKTIQPKSDQLNSDDLIGGSITVKITNVTKSESPDQPIAISYEGDNGKPYKPCKSMRRVLVQVWGKDGTSYIGKSMTLYRDEKVMFGGVAVGGIRISHMSDIKEKITLALTATRANKKPFTVQPLATTQQVKKIDPKVKADGDEAASKGVEAYTEWLGSLAPEIKETVRPYHNDWSKKAKAYVPPKEEEVPFDEEDDTPEM